MNQETKYPPGSDRRLIDWVRYPPGSSGCVRSKCTEIFTRETPEGVLCLHCYIKIPSCDHPGCHKPAMDAVENPETFKRRRVWIPKCREHYYDAELEKEVMDEQREHLQRGSSYTNGATY